MLDPNHKQNENNSFSIMCGSFRPLKINYTRMESKSLQPMNLIDFSNNNKDEINFG
jgi:hypothetical protein